MTDRIKLNFKLFGDFLYMAEGDDQWHSLDELSNASIGKKQLAFLIGVPKPCTVGAAS